MKHVAIMGGGQLARMMALAGIPMGIHFSFLMKPGEDDSCVYLLGNSVYYSDKDKMLPGQLYRRLGKPDVITIESENVDLDLLESLEEFCKVVPSVASLKKVKSRISEKLFVAGKGINTSRFFPFFNHDDLVSNSPMLKFPVIVKSAEGGYDGKHQYRIEKPADLHKFEIPNSPDGYIAEEVINFTREISFIAVRSQEGKMLFYPVTENTHQDAVLVTSMAPARKVPKRIVNIGRSSLAHIMSELDFVGVMAMECFLVEGDGEPELLVNELAPRVHNSGHWTQGGCSTSQFENHLRAILGFSLGSTRQLGFSAMLNMLGVDRPSPETVNEHTSVHWYNKKYRQGRKMGHINIRSDNPGKVTREVKKLSALMSTKSPPLNSEAS